MTDSESMDKRQNIPLAATDVETAGPPSALRTSGSAVLDIRALAAEAREGRSEAKGDSANIPIPMQPEAERKEGNPSSYFQACFDELRNNIDIWMYRKAALHKIIERKKKYLALVTILAILPLFLTFVGGYIAIGASVFSMIAAILQLWNVLTSDQSDVVKHYFALSNAIVILSSSLGQTASTVGEEQKKEILRAAILSNTLRSQLETGFYRYLK